MKIGDLVHWKYRDKDEWSIGTAIYIGEGIGNAIGKYYVVEEHWRLNFLQGRKFKSDVVGYIKLI